MKALVTLLTILALTFQVGCQEYRFHDNHRSYGEPTATAIENDIVVDEFRAIHLEPVDILFVVDDSCSMGDDQGKLGEHLPTLGKELMRLDINYRVAFTTITSYWYEGELRELPTNRGYAHWIDPETKGKVDLFVYGATPGTRGGGAEAGLAATYSIFGHTNPYSFFRKNSSFHTVVISDEPDQSEYTHLRSQVDPESRFIRKFNNFREYNSFSIIGEEIYADQDKYNRVARKTGGYIIDLNGDDWDDFLVEFANSIEFNPEFRFYLSHIPADYTKIHVTVCEDVDGDGECVGWSTSPDLTHIYKYNKNNWSYKYDHITNSILLVSPKRELKDYDFITATYEIPTGSPEQEE